MQRTTGDIWNLYGSHWIVIPTNYGWKRDGSNVMGRGLAAQAAKRYPQLPRLYGKVCRDIAYSETPDGSFAPLPFFVHGDTGLIFFVVKPLRKDAPHLSWQQPATLGCIEASCRELAEWIIYHMPDTRPIALPMVGCGNGQLDRKDVEPILERHFGAMNNVVLVEY